jgi:hypothetical protein
MQRTLLEIPREMPGFLVIPLYRLLFALGDIRIAAIANVAAAWECFCWEFNSVQFFIMLLVVFIYSTDNMYFYLYLIPSE